MTVEGKRCSKCGETKSVDEFNSDKTKKDGRDYQCKSCRRSGRQSEKGRAQQKARRQSDKYKAYMRAYMRAYSESDEHKAYRQAYIQSDEYKAYRQSDEYKAQQKAHKQSEEYKAKFLISTTAGIPPSQVPDDLLQAKIRQLRIYRFIKEQEKHA